MTQYTEKLNTKTDFGCLVPLACDANIAREGKFLTENRRDMLEKQIHYIFQECMEK